MGFKEHRVRCSQCNNLVCHDCRSENLCLCYTCENKLITSGWHRRYNDQWVHQDIRNHTEETTVSTSIAFYIEDLKQLIRKLLVEKRVNL